MGRDQTVVLGVLLLAVGVAVGAGAVALADGGTAAPRATPETPDNTTDPFAATDASLTQFESDSAFADYVRRGRRLAEDHGFQSRRRPVDRRRVAEEPDIVRDTPVATEAPEMASGDGGGGASAPERVSGTNVQVAGIDEPDLVKTDGAHLYYASPRDRPRPRAPWEGDGRGDGETSVLSIETPPEPTRVADIDAAGQLLRSGDTLVVMEEDKLVGHDVSDPADPEEVWTQELADEVVTARLTDGTMYLVTRSAVSLSDPCPVEPLGGAASVACTDIYRPSGQVPVDATYTALALDPTSGDVRETATFVGTSDTTAVYMSNRSLYVTYSEGTRRAELRLDFLLTEQSDRLPDRTLDRLRTLRGYNISAEAKAVETRRILRDWARTLGDDERQRVRSNIENDFRSYLAAHQRDLVRTGIVRVSTDDLSVESVGTVPGRPLDQFSLSEHDGTLRITTTVPSAGSAESGNDLYTLDADTLDRRGAVTDMGAGQRVYATRYVGDTAYVITFRRVDPLHVVDLSDPDDPAEVGELELPGFSTYLHPIDDDRVLGIGEEDGRVKAVLFDVSDPSDPTVADDYVLDARFSAVSESHHAFLLDREHGVFFLPTGQGGRVVDYTDDDLSLEATVDTAGSALRARYVDDSLYVFGHREVVVVDERTWERTATLDLDD